MRAWIFAVVAAAAASSAAAAEPMQEYLVDEIIPLGADSAAKISIVAGPVEFTEVRVRNRPSQADLAEHSGPRDRDQSHVKPTVFARTSTRSPVELRLAVMLQDAEGRDHIRCDRTVTLEPGDTDDFNTCMREGLYTRDWTRVTSLHLTALVRVKASEVAAPTGRREVVGSGDDVVLHYHRADKDYDGWALTAWEEFPDRRRTLAFSEWKDPLAPTGRDGFGVYWVLKASNFRQGVVGYTVHRGDVKGQHGKEEKSFRIADGREVWASDAGDGAAPTAEQALQPR